MAVEIIPGGYRYSYSGSDARCYAYFPPRGDKVFHVESLHTISWSVHEAKGDARALGYRAVKGFARGVRTVAGSLITTVIEDHPLAGLMELMIELQGEPLISYGGWSIDADLVGVGSGIDNTTFTRRLAPTIAPFNILVQYVTEGAQWTNDPVRIGNTNIPGAASLIVGVEFIDEGMVTSISDAVSEMTYSFKARDVKTLSQQEFTIVRSLFGTYNELEADDAALRNVLTLDQRTREEQYKRQYQELIAVPGEFPEGMVS